MSGDEVNFLLSRPLGRRRCRYPRGVEVRLPEAPGNPEEASFPHGGSLSPIAAGIAASSSFARPGRRPRQTRGSAGHGQRRRATPKTRLLQFVSKATVSLSPGSAAGGARLRLRTCLPSRSRGPAGVSLLPWCEEQCRAPDWDGARPRHCVDAKSDPGCLCPFLCRSRL